HKSFRAWLRTVTLNKWRERRRRRELPREDQPVALAEQAGPDDAEAFWEAEYRQQLVGRALDVMRAEFQPAVWQAYWEYVTSGDTAAAVAARLGISVDSVYAAKSRVLRRLRQELEGLLD